MMFWANTQTLIANLEPRKLFQTLSDINNVLQRSNITNNVSGGRGSWYSCSRYSA